jgi:hypothetical protein
MITVMTFTAIRTSNLTQYYCLYCKYICHHNGCILLLLWNDQCTEITQVVHHSREKENSGGMPAQIPGAHFLKLQLHAQLDKIIKL